MRCIKIGDISEDIQSLVEIVTGKLSDATKRWRKQVLSVIISNLYIKIDRRVSNKENPTYSAYQSERF